MKIAFLCLPGLESFVKPVVDHLSKNHECKECYSKEKSEIEQAIQWADLVWLEWGNEMAIMVTRQLSHLLIGKKVLVRIHSYEVLSGFLYNIDWPKVDYVLFVAEHVRKFGSQQINEVTRGLCQDLATYVIPNGVNMFQFILESKLVSVNPERGYSLVSSKDRGKNIAYIGDVNHKKGPMLMIHAFNQLINPEDRWDSLGVSIEGDKEYMLHVAGVFHEPRFDIYWAHMLKEMNLEKNVVMHGHVSDMSLWLRDKHFVVCSSPWESQHMGVMEAMATGCMPLIHNFPGAKDIYPEKFIWTTIDEFVDKVLNLIWEPGLYRQIVQDRYSLEVVNKSLDEVMADIEKEYLYGQEIKLN